MPVEPEIKRLIEEDVVEMAKELGWSSKETEVGRGWIKSTVWKIMR